MSVTQVIASQVSKIIHIRDILQGCGGHVRRFVVPPFCECLHKLIKKVQAYISRATQLNTLIGLMHHSL